MLQPPQLSTCTSRRFPQHLIIDICEMGHTPGSAQLIAVVEHVCAEVMRTETYMDNATTWLIIILDRCSRK